MDQGSMGRVYCLGVCTALLRRFSGLVLSTSVLFFFSLPFLFALVYHWWSIRWACCRCVFRSGSSKVVFSIISHHNNQLIDIILTHLLVIIHRFPCSAFSPSSLSMLLFLFLLSIFPLL
ncbi:hypothetical protein BDY21DRAFT_97386 [Lineolata rhizophorae]|uniref:Uncharacterized protein n=1 Tax=Lineolata rhizophorae TaxID=578093 RepID=A0A6A6NT89_9PEZI|nr:hypothetical protein BDY21DRAFT_97386 [Lineolata rhizophorae]